MGLGVEQPQQSTRMCDSNDRLEAVAASRPHSVVNFLTQVEIVASRIHSSSSRVLKKDYMLTFAEVCCLHVV